jgi:hypothetical protein
VIVLAPLLPDERLLLPREEPLLYAPLLPLRAITLVVVAVAVMPRCARRAAAAGERGGGAVGAAAGGSDGPSDGPRGLALLGAGRKETPVPLPEDGAAS